MPAPTVDDVIAYLYSRENGNGSLWSEDVVASALAAEKASQASRCRVPTDLADWPADLAEALMRRVMHNLELRGNATGVQTSNSEFGVTTTRIGGLDAEVRRLEAPHRRLVIG